MHGLSYQLRLLEPMLAGSLGGDPNSARSLPFVPGALVRGALIGTYGAALDAANTEARRLFLDGRTRFLHAYLLLAGERERGLPLPLSWHRDKQEPADRCRLRDLCVDVANDDEQLVRLPPDAWCRVTSGGALSMRQEDYVNVHTQRDPVRGRATVEEGAVFRYEALAAGQAFGGVILTENAADAARLKELLQGRRFKLGKSRTAGYGLMEIESVAELRTNWRETNAGRLRPTDRFTLTCLSEVLVRDVRGHFSLNPVPALQKALGVNLGIARHEQTQEALIFRRTEVVGGFNRKWGMPLPQVTALAAGSVFVLTAEHPIAAEALQTLEDLGLGERRAEGYGRVAINWYESAPPQFTKDTSQRLVRAAHAVTLTTAERRLAQAMLDRQFRRDLEQKLLKAINELDISGALPNSQLSRWRSVIHSALALKEAAQQLDRLNQFRAHEADKNSRAWERLRRARLVGRNLRLTEWIEDVLTHTDAPWHWFPADAKPVPLKLSEDLQSRLTDDLAIEFRLRLLDGVLARHAKLQPGQDKQSGGNQ